METIDETINNHQDLTIVSIIGADVPEYNEARYVEVKLRNSMAGNSIEGVISGELFRNLKNARVFFER